MLKKGNISQVPLFFRNHISNSESCQITHSPFSLLYSLKARESILLKGRGLSPPQTPCSESNISFSDRVPRIAKPENHKQVPEWINQKAIDLRKKKKGNTSTVWKLPIKESKPSSLTLWNQVFRLSEEYKSNYIFKPYL